MSQEPRTAESLDALNRLVQTIADAVNDTTHVIHDKPNPIGAFSQYANLLNDIMGLVPQIGALPGEIEALDKQQVQYLINSLVGKLDIPDGKAKDVIQAVTKAINDIIQVTIDDIKGVVDAAREQANAAPEGSQP